MNWMTADKALAPLRSGMRVFIGSGCAAPQKLVSALTRRGRELFDVEVIHILTFGMAEYASRELLANFRHNAFFIGPNVRDAVNEGVADYTPIFLSDVPALFRRKKIHLDMALIQVSPPDAHGFCSFGVSVDVVKAAVESADYVVAEVNPNMPRTLGDSFVHVSRLNALVQSIFPILEFSLQPPSPEAKKIAEYVASLVEDGATLQTGIGEIPSAVMASLAGRRDLGMHTEMFTEAVIPLIESGAMNCRLKTLLPGKIVTSFCFGTRKLYDYIHNNPLFEFRPTEFTNDPFQIAQNRKMVAISSAIEVDLTGQSSADSIGDRFYSGFGGQTDFVRGAARVDDGKPILALPSTTRDGTISRICGRLKPGSGVVTTRADAHYIVTEFGIADLHGKSVRERTLALIHIAHPKFRDDLMREARERNLLHPNQIALPAGLLPYPKKFEINAKFKDGLNVHFRPIQPMDETLLKELFYSHSEQTIPNRYLAHIRHLSHEQVQKFVTLDYCNDFALVGVVPHEGRERMISVGRYFHNPASSEAEVAITVHDDFQNRGIGTFLTQTLAKIASENGITAFTANVRADNHGMLHVFKKVASKLEMELDSNVYRVRFDLGAVEPGQKMADIGQSATSLTERTMEKSYS
ncbi:MAG TPA: GNAT family N-acetyltransferase [Verrucomicrobiae bacterium]|jgi:acyl-CoA hydrolase/RimJ/RimL family protein N-acetyltransferase|nr:GNAT family N-acetyltransferase [Verrucomicrobiae bacterium]